MEDDHRQLVDAINLQYKRDQEMRHRWAAHNFETAYFSSEVDNESQKLVRNVLKKLGWPKMSLFGKEIVERFWVLVQHASDVSLQKSALEAMNKLPLTEVDGTLIAKTTDRVRIKEGRKQLYGTSFTIDLSTQTLSVDPIEDPDNIDSRRKSLGMDSFDEQKKRAFDSFNNR